MNETTTTLIIFAAAGLVAAFYFDLFPSRDRFERGIASSYALELAQGTHAAPSSAASPSASPKPAVGIENGAAVVRPQSTQKRQAAPRHQSKTSLRLAGPFGWIAGASWLIGSLWMLIASFGVGLAWGLVVLFGNLFGSLIFAAIHPREGGMPLVLMWAGAVAAMAFGRPI